MQKRLALAREIVGGGYRGILEFDPARLKQAKDKEEKYYAVDIGLRWLLLGQSGTDVGHILENVVYLELLRRGYKVYVGKVNALEVDFITESYHERLT